MLRNDRSTANHLTHIANKPRKLIHQFYQHDMNILIKWSASIDHKYIALVTTNRRNAQKYSMAITRMPGYEQTYVGHDSNMFYDI